MLILHQYIYKGKGRQLQTDFCHFMYCNNSGKSVKYQIMNNLSNYKLITNYKMAYIKVRSTQCALSFYNDWLKSMDKGLTGYLSLPNRRSKCFDCGQNNILIDRVNKDGSRFSELHWFQSYFKLGNQKS